MILNIKRQRKWTPFGPSFQDGAAIARWNAHWKNNATFFLIKCNFNSCNGMEFSFIMDPTLTCKINYGWLLNNSVMHFFISKQKIAKQEYLKATAIRHPYPYKIWVFLNINLFKELNPFFYPPYCKTIAKIQWVLLAQERLGNTQLRLKFPHSYLPILWPIRSTGSITTLL